MTTRPHIVDNSMLAIRTRTLVDMSVIVGEALGTDMPIEAVKRLTHPPRKIVTPLYRSINERS